FGERDGRAAMQNPERLPRAIVHGHARDDPRSAQFEQLDAEYVAESAGREDAKLVAKLVREFSHDLRRAMVRARARSAGSSRAVDGVAPRPRTPRRGTP